MTYKIFEGNLERLEKKLIRIANKCKKYGYSNMDNEWKEEVDSLRVICKSNEIPALVERSRSGNGAHIWIFFDAPISASLVRRFGFALLEKGAETVNLRSFKYSF